MTLAYPLLPTPISFSECNIQVLVIENTFELRQFISTLISQISGLSGDFVLAENSKILEFSKFVDFVTDPFSISFDSKIITAKLQREAAELGAVYADDFRDILFRLNSLAGKISTNFDHEVTYTPTDSLDDMIRLMGFCVDIESLSFPERILEYIRLHRKYFGKQLFVFFNLKAVFTINEALSFYHQIKYEGINLLLVEDTPRKNGLEDEHVTIVDADLCVL